MQLIAPMPMPMPKADSVEGCTQAVMEAVPPVLWFIRKHMRRHRKGLSLQQFRALVRVDRYPSASLSAVADHLGASRPTASRIIAGLVRQGLLTRRGCSEDRRQVALAITAKGRSMVDAAWTQARREMEAVLCGLPAAERGVVTEAMTILRRSFGSLESPAAEASRAAPHGRGNGRTRRPASAPAGAARV